MDRGGRPQAPRQGFPRHPRHQHVVQGVEQLAVANPGPAALAWTAGGLGQQGLGGSPQGGRGQKIGGNRSFVVGCSRGQGRRLVGVGTPNFSPWLPLLYFPDRLLIKLRPTTEFFHHINQQSITYNLPSKYFVKYPLPPQKVLLPLQSQNVKRTTGAETNTGKKVSRVGTPAVVEMSIPLRPLRKPSEK